MQQDNLPIDWKSFLTKNEKNEDGIATDWSLSQFISDAI
jgi:hypothetical protein